MRCLKKCLLKTRLSGLWSWSNGICLTLSTLISACLKVCSLKRYAEWCQCVVNLSYFHPSTVICHYSSYWQSRFTALEGDFRIGSIGCSEGAHLLSGPLSRWGVQLSSHTNQFAQMAGSDLQPTPLTVWECACSPGVRAYCYARLAVLPYRTITLAHVMSRENFSPGWFTVAFPQFKIRSILVPWCLCLSPTLLGVLVHICFWSS